MADDCTQYASAELVRGIEEFNAGKYYESHETIEDIWKVEAGPVRDLFKALIMFGAAMHHIGLGHRRGPKRLLTRARELSRPFAPLCRSIDVAHLRESARLVLDFLHTEDESTPFPDRLIPQLPVPEAEPPTREDEIPRYT